MLNKIVFFSENEKQLQEALKLKKNIGRDDNFIEIHKSCELEKSGYLAEYKGDILFAADKGETLQTLKKSGANVIAWIHEDNGEQDLSDAVYGITTISEMDYESLEKAYQRASGKPWMITETKRCIIRETVVEDVDSFYDIYAEPSISYYMENLFIKPEEEKAYTEEYIGKIYGFYGYGLWSIIHKESGKIIGRAGLSWREGYDIPELGFMIAVPFQRHGLAYEVCSAILNYGAEELEFYNVQALVKKENTASIRLCEKLGCKREETVEEKGEIYERYVWRQENAARKT